MSVTVSFEGLKASVRPPSSTFSNPVRRRRNTATSALSAPKQLLKGISGRLEAGKLTAIMGSSGAGKSVLMSILSGRSGSMYDIQGNITVNGEPITPEDLRNLCGFAMQDDVMLPNLTVREQIEFHARLTASTTTSEDEIQNSVQSMLDLMSLGKCSETRVGKPGYIRGISGGERKRTAVGMELVSDPVVLFLDEPTTGLDSEVALQVVKTLKDVARKGRTVACSIHQPSSETFLEFDNLLLLCLGEVVYFGSVQDAPAHFAKIGYPVPEDCNPCDWYLKLLHRASVQKLIASGDISSSPRALVELKRDAEAGQKEEKDDVKEDLLGYLIKERPDFEEKKEELTADIELVRRSTIQMVEVRKKKVKINFFRQTSILLHRGATQYFRTLEILVRFGANIVLCFFMGILFLLPDEGSAGIQARFGSFMVFHILFSFLNAQGFILVFPYERPVFLREQAKGLYHPLAYFLSKNIIEIFPLFLNIFIGVLSSYFLIKLRADATAFFRAVFCFFLVGTMGQSVGFLVGSITPDIGRGLELAPSIIIPQTLTAGLFLNVRDTPSYMIWLERISFFRWAFEASMQNEFSSRTLKEPSIFAPTAQGDQVLEYFGFIQGYGASIGILILLCVFWRMLAYAALRYTVKTAVAV